MYARKKTKDSMSYINNSYEGETLEKKIQRLVQNKEPLDGTVPLTYTERKDGVKAETNIRTDKWELAAEAMNSVAGTHIAKREGKIVDMKKKEGKDEGGNEGGKETGG